jgi:hypothetical protein
MADKKVAKTKADFDPAKEIKQETNWRTVGMETARLIDLMDIIKKYQVQQGDPELIKGLNTINNKLNSMLAEYVKASVQ